MAIGGYFRLNYHKLLMAIGGYSIIGHWWLYYYWLLMAILLVVFFVILGYLRLLVDILSYIIIGY
jgi:hypothetical protein